MVKPETPCKLFTVRLIAVPYNKQANKAERIANHPNDPKLSSGLNRRTTTPKKPIATRPNTRSPTANTFTTLPILPELSQTDTTTAQIQLHTTVSFLTADPQQQTDFATTSSGSTWESMYAESNAMSDSPSARSFLDRRKDSASG